MKPDKFIINRDIFAKEAYWLADRDSKLDDVVLSKGTIVYECLKYDYGCTSPKGMFMTYSPEGDYQGFEVPLDALEKVKD